MPLVRQEVRMRIRLLVPVLVAAVTAVLSAQAFDLRLGQWEYSISGMKLPPELLAQLPPEARAQAEQAMRQAGNNRSCLTAQDLKDLNLGKNDDEDCKVTSKKLTGNAADIVITCTGDEPRTQTIHYEALSRESVRGTIKVKGGSGPSEMAITGKWVAAACKE
jgi:hypothetical protein